MLFFGILALTSISVQQQMENMTIKQKVGQVIMAHVRAKKVNDDAKKLVDLGIGGIIYYTWANGLDSFDQVKNLSSGLQKNAKIPLFIAVDQEGGIVERLQNGFTRWPGNRALGETNDQSLACQAAYCIGRELLAAGMNVNFAPVVDVNSNPNNPVIGVRSFGEDPQKVADFGLKAVEGFEQARIIPCLKHAPGHGDTGKDSHADLPIINKTLEEIREVDLYPFKCIPSRMVMTAHILIPTIDPDNCSTLSKKTLDLIREETGFEGVIISDSLVMEGVLKGAKKVDDVAIKAFNAGCDIVLLGGSQLHGAKTFELSVEDVEHVHKSMVNAVGVGEISLERLDEAVGRILTLKSGVCKSLKTPLTSGDLKKHSLLALEIATKALKVTVNDPSVDVSIKGKKSAIILPQFLRQTLEGTSLSTIKDSHVVSFGEKVPEDVEVLIICSYNAHADPIQQAQILTLIELGKPVNLVVLRNPQDEELFAKAARVIKTFSPSKPSFDAVGNFLKG